MACPMGVVIPYSTLMNHGFRLVVEKDGMAAIREPKARPSNVWWKEIAMSRTTKAGPVETERAMPMKTLWKRMPASRSRHWRMRRWSCIAAGEVGEGGIAVETGVAKETLREGGLGRPFEDVMDECALVLVFWSSVEECGVVGVFFVLQLVEIEI